MMISEFTAHASAETDGRDDQELLAEFLSGSEPAFTTLVARHIDAVYSAALRQVRDPHTAADVTSAAFIVLSRKATSLDGRTVVSAWLHRTTRYIALKALRANQRRQKYEQQAADMEESLQSPTTDETGEVWMEVAPLLDDGLARLTAKDHEVVVLRFFQNKTFPQIAALVGGTEEGARKRVHRGVDKLRRFLVGRGVSVPAALLTATLVARSVQPSPVGLLDSIGVVSRRATVSALVVETLRMLQQRVWQQIAASLGALAAVLGVLFMALSPVFPVSTGSPLQTLRLLTRSAENGDAERWSSLIHVSTFDEQQIRSVLVSNMVAQSKLRGLLVQGFGPVAYEASDFPRLLDDTPESQMRDAVERIDGDRATIHLPRGSDLKFVHFKDGWRFDFFGTTRVGLPALRVSLGKDLFAAQETARQLSTGTFRQIVDARDAFQRLR